MQEHYIQVTFTKLGEHIVRYFVYKYGYRLYTVTSKTKVDISGAKVQNSRVNICSIDYEAKINTFEIVMLSCRGDTTKCLKLT